MVAEDKLEAIYETGRRQGGATGKDQPAVVVTWTAQLAGIASFVGTMVGKIFKKIDSKTEEFRVESRDFAHSCAGRKGLRSAMDQQICV